MKINIKPLGNLWFIECKICDNLDKNFSKCKCSLWQPQVINGTCVRYKEVEQI